MLFTPLDCDFWLFDLYLSLSSPRFLPVWRFEWVPARCSLLPVSASIFQAKLVSPFGYALGSSCPPVGPVGQICWDNCS